MRFLATFLIVLFLSSCDPTTVMRSTDKVPDSVIYEEYNVRDEDFSNQEVDHEKDIANMSLQHSTLENTLLDKYLNDILNNLKKASGTDIEAKVHAFIDSGGISAQALPNGTIFFGISSMSKLDIDEETKSTKDGKDGKDEGSELTRDDEVAFILAHELAHLLLRHHKADNIKKFQNELLGDATQLYSYFASNKNDKASKKVDNYIGRAKFFRTIHNNFLFPVFERQQEIDADYLALDLIVEAGYSPETAIMALQKLVAIEEAKEKIKDSDMLDDLVELSIQSNMTKEDGFLKDYLDVKGEVKKIQNLFSDSPLVGEFVSGFSSSFQGLSKRLGGSLKNLLSKRHFSAEKRLALIIDYYEKHYEDKFDGKAFNSGKELEKIKNNGTIKKYLKSYEQAYKARYYITEGKLKEAEKSVKEADKAVRGLKAFDSYISEISAMVKVKQIENSKENGETEKAQGYINKAIKTLEESINGGNATFINYNQLLEIYETKGENMSKVRKLLDKMSSKFAKTSSPMVFTALIEGYLMANQKSKALNVKKKCPSEYKDKCRDAYEKYEESRAE